MASPWQQSATVKALERENDELRLYVAAIVRLLVAKGVVTSEEMASLVQAIDAEDGSADGKYKGPIG